MGTLGLDAILEGPAFGSIRQRQSERVAAHGLEPGLPVSFLADGPCQELDADVLAGHARNDDAVGQDQKHGHVGVGFGRLFERIEGGCVEPGPSAYVSPCFGVYGGQHAQFALVGDPAGVSVQRVGQF